MSSRDPLTGRHIPWVLAAGTALTGVFVTLCWAVSEAVSQAVS